MQFVAVYLTELQQIALSLHWCSFLEDSSDIVTSTVTHTGGQYFDYGLMLIGFYLILTVFTLIIVWHIFRQPLHLPASQQDGEAPICYPSSPVVLMPLHSS